MNEEISRVFTEARIAVNDHAHVEKKRRSAGTKSSNHAKNTKITKVRKLLERQDRQGGGRQLVEEVGVVIKEVGVVIKEVGVVIKEVDLVIK